MLLHAIAIDVPVRDQQMIALQPDHSLDESLRGLAARGFVARLGLADARLRVAADRFVWVGALRGMKHDDVADPRGAWPGG